MHVGDDLLAVEHQPGVARRAQGRVKHRTVFGDVDLLAGEHGVAALRHAGGDRQVLQEAHCFVGDGAFRPIEQQVVAGGGEAGEALRVRGERRPHVTWRLRTMIAQRSKLRFNGGFGHCGTPWSKGFAAS